MWKVELKFFNIGGVKKKRCQIKDIVFGLDPKHETKIIIYKETEQKWMK